jgi:hypothetical protein
MANRFEKWGFTPEMVESLGLREPPDSLEGHRERIQNKLRAFLSAQEARDTATRIHSLALEVDEEIGRILQDPRVGRRYEYDGRFFTARDVKLFHIAFDGIHLLESLTDSSLELFFRGRQKHAAIRGLLDDLDKHAWVVRVRRLNWEEFETLGLVPPDILDEIIKSAKAREREAETPPLSVEEQDFFQPFEEQMRVSR